MASQRFRHSHLRRRSPPLLWTMAAIQQREDDVAHWRRNNGLSRVERVPRARDTQFLPHPSRGGSRGYDIPFRQMILENHNAGRPVPRSLMRSVRRWARNHIPRRMTGNKSRSELSGYYLFLLVLFKMIWPHSSYYECIAFIANETINSKILADWYWYYWYGCLICQMWMHLELTRIMNDCYNVYANTISRYKSNLTTSF